jgi:hypothetical protein
MVSSVPEEQPVQQVEGNERERREATRDPAPRTLRRRSLALSARPRPQQQSPSQPGPLASSPAASSPFPPSLNRSTSREGLAAASSVAGGRGQDAEPARAVPSPAASPMPTPKQSSARREANSSRSPLSPRRPPRCSSSLLLRPCWQRQSHDQLRLSHGRRPRTCTTRRATAGAVSRRTERLARALMSRGTRESQVRPCSRPVLTLQPTGRSSPACTTFSASSPFVRSTPLLDDSLTHSCVPRSLSRSHTAQSFPKSRSRPRSGSSRSRSAFTARQRLG